MANEASGPRPCRKILLRYHREMLASNTLHFRDNAPAL